MNFVCWTVNGVAVLGGMGKMKKKKEKRTSILKYVKVTWAENSIRMQSNLTFPEGFPRNSLLCFSYCYFSCNKVQ